MNSFQLKQILVVKMGAEAGNFVDTAYLTGYNLTGFKSIYFKFLT